MELATNGGTTPANRLINYGRPKPNLLEAQLIGTTLYQASAKMHQGQVSMLFEAVNYLGVVIMRAVDGLKDTIPHAQLPPAGEMVEARRGRSAAFRMLVRMNRVRKRQRKHPFENLTVVSPR